MGTRNLPVTADAIDLEAAAEEAERAQDRADEIAARFSRAAAEIAEVAAFVRRHPHLARHMRNVDLGVTARINVYVGGYGGGGAATIAEFATAAARAGYKVVKKPGGTEDQFFGVEIHFGWPHIYVYADREQVCERVVTGTREVVEEIPDPDAPKITRTRTEEIVEYHCGPLLGGGRDG